MYSLDQFNDYICCEYDRIINNLPSQDASAGVIRIVSFRFISLSSPVRAGTKMIENAPDTPKSNSNRFLTVTAIA